MQTWRQPRSGLRLRSAHLAQLRTNIDHAGLARYSSQIIIITLFIMDFYDLSYNCPSLMLLHRKPWEFNCPFQYITSLKVLIYKQEVDKLL